MKRSVPIILFLFAVCVPMFSQNADRIRNNPSYIWAEASSFQFADADGIALDALVDKLSATGVLPLEQPALKAVWMTYKADVRRVSRVVTDGDAVLRFVRKEDVRSIFSGRERKFDELCKYAHDALDGGHAEMARRYLEWADIYLQSMPASGGMRSELDALIRKAGPGPVAYVRMRNIETETEQILAALRKKAPERVVPERVVKPSEPAAPSPVPRVFQTVPPMDIFPAGLVHTMPSSVLFRSEKTTQSSPAPSLKPDWTLFFMGDALISKSVLGGFFGGATVNGIGAYVSFDSDFQSAREDYSCGSDGSTSYGFIWTSGEQRHHGESFTIGPVCNVGKTVSIYGGLGYGISRYYWKDIQQRWALVEDMSFGGLTVRAGVIVSLGHFCMSCGFSSVALRNAGVAFGAGMRF